MPDETTPPAPAANKPPQIITDNLKNNYVNVCRITPTPTEMIIDFGMNPNFAGMLIEEPLKLDTRLIMSPDGAKRLCVSLMTVIQAYERRFGEIELDVSKRVKPQAPPAQ